MVSNPGRFRTAFEQFNMFWTLDTPNKILQPEIQASLERATKFYGIFRNLIGFVFVIYTCFPLIFVKGTLPAIWYSICDLSTSPCFEMSYTYQAVNAFVFVFITLGYEGLFMIMLSFTYSELKMIRMGFQKIDTKVIDEGNGRKLKKDFDVLVEQHSIVLKQIFVCNETIPDLKAMILDL